MKYIIKIIVNYMKEIWMVWKKSIEIWSWLSYFWKGYFGRFWKKTKYDIEIKNNEKELTMDEPGNIVQGQSVSKEKPWFMQAFKDHKGGLQVSCIGSNITLQQNN